MPKPAKRTATPSVALDIPTPQPIAPTRDLLKLEEVALYCEVSTQTLRKEIKKGRLIATRVGRQLRIPTRELKAYLDRQATGA